MQTRIPNYPRMTPALSRALYALQQEVDKSGIDPQDTQVPDEVYERGRKHFSEEEIVHLTYAVAIINSWNRLAPNPPLQGWRGEGELIVCDLRSSANSARTMQEITKPTAHVGFPIATLNP